MNKDHGRAYGMGREAGYIIGHTMGREAGYIIGHADGREAGYKDGYEAGKKEVLDALFPDEFKKELIKALKEDLGEKND